MKRRLLCLLTFIGFLLAGCERAAQGPRPDGRLSDGRPQVEVTVQQ